MALYSKQKAIKK